ncbi:saccharopine dehydrogenase C-terminal domain-containing protein [Cloacibacillus sp. An23]|uniref:saccharopine dehydrogenase C-terminal domain-containing protein n=1 Tax=Cloacibacillus sp. An23 TaxID=1965591 RepID=UPI001302C440|nr:saccharopine dehydrogenase C-terminal domain-containing protein [Cloacibacillus sp. An23]
MKKALVLGCGLIGKTVAIDLAKDFEVTVMDPFEKALASLGDRNDIKKIQKSADDAAALAEAAKDADVICGLLPSHLEEASQKQILEMGKNYVSPSGYLHSSGMDEIAKKSGSVAVFDMGIAPGMSNYLVARGGTMVDELDFGCIYVGGIPDKLDPPFNYRTVFCLEDTMNEYCWPARYVKDNKITETPALSGLEEIDIPGVGRLEAFFTDGLRSASENVKGKFVAEKTMRWPGYVDTINILKAAGCFSKEPVVVDGKDVIPFNVTTELFRPLWTLRPEKGDRDLTVMRVVAKGPKDGKYVTNTWDLVDKFDEEQMLHSMARTTGYPCAATARAIAYGIISEPGFHAPESLAADDKFYSYLMPQLAEHGIVFKHSVLVEEI